MRYGYNRHWCPLRQQGCYCPRGEWHCCHRRRNVRRRCVFKRTGTEGALASTVVFVPPHSPQLVDLGDNRPHKPLRLPCSGPVMLAPALGLCLGCQHAHALAHLDARHHVHGKGMGWRGDATRKQSNRMTEMSCLRGQSNIMSGARVFGPQAWTGDAGDADHYVSLVDCLMEYCDLGRRKQTSSFSALPWSPRARISIQGSSHQSGGREHSQAHGSSDNVKARASPSTTDIGNFYNGTTDNCSLGGARLSKHLSKHHH
jgi:hypothetical protein